MKLETLYDGPVDEAAAPPRSPETGLYKVRGEVLEQDLIIHARPFVSRSVDVQA